MDLELRLYSGPKPGAWPPTITLPFRLKRHTIFSDPSRLSALLLSSLTQLSFPVDRCSNFIGALLPCARNLTTLQIVWHSGDNYDHFIPFLKRCTSLRYLMSSAVKSGFSSIHHLPVPLKGWSLRLDYWNWETEFSELSITLEEGEGIKSEKLEEMVLSL